MDAPDNRRESAMAQELENYKGTVAALEAALSRLKAQVGAGDARRWEEYEDMRSRYASACERMGMAHANGTRAEWEDAARSEIERRLALNAAVRALRSLASRDPARGSPGQGDATLERKDGE